MAERPEPDLGAVLRQEAERHVPDRAAMLTRISEQRTATRSRWAFTTLRPVAAAASVVATLVVGFAGIRLAGDRGGGAEPPAAASVAPTPSPTVAASAEPDKPTRPSRTTRTGERSTAPGVHWQPSSGFLSSAAVLDSHSNDTWAQGNLTLTTTETITRLDVVISVARTEGVEDAGKWSSVPAEMITMVVDEEKDALVYRFTLHDGKTLAAGQYVFAAQYMHATGERDTGGDSYGAIAWAGDKKVEVTGQFKN
ncbi:hypothetical protein OHA21_45075 [Actinoplanes sp. NBC_00393]|uniref:hypothetical protein n=1 Tax=Actinoplanes sp. NBC_00393 TaxID=2975953 RepID=UPI002E1B4508